jgi:hypothetical protein
VQCGDSNAAFALFFFLKDLLEHCALVEPYYIYIAIKHIACCIFFSRVSIYFISLLYSSVSFFLSMDITENALNDVIVDFKV